MGSSLGRLHVEKGAMISGTLLRVSFSMLVGVYPNISGRELALFRKLVTLCSANIYQDKDDHRLMTVVPGEFVCLSEGFQNQERS